MSAQHKPRWTAEEDAELRKMLATGHSRSDIARALGRTEAGVKARKELLQVPGKERRPARQNSHPENSHPGRWAKYGDAEDGYLTELWLMGYQRAEIARQLTRKFGIPRSEHSVAARRILLGLSERPAGYRPPEALRPKKAQRAPAPVQKEGVDFFTRANVNHSLDWRGVVTQRRAEKRRAWDHAQRLKALGPMGKDEAEALIAAAIRAGRVTKCPPRFVAPITGAPE